MTSHAENMQAKQSAIVRTLDKMSMTIADLDATQAKRLASVESVLLSAARAIEELSASITTLTDHQHEMSQALVAIGDLQVEANRRLAKLEKIQCG